MNAVLSGSPVKVMSFAMLVVAVFAVTFATGSDCPPYSKAAKTACPGKGSQECPQTTGCPGSAQNVYNGNFGTDPLTDKDKTYAKLGLVKVDDALCSEFFSKCINPKDTNKCIGHQASKQSYNVTQYVTKDCP